MFRQIEAWVEHNPAENIRPTVTASGDAAHRLTHPISPTIMLCGNFRIGRIYEAKVGNGVASDTGGAANLQLL